MTVKTKTRAGVPLAGGDGLTHWRSAAGRTYPYYPDSTRAVYMPDCNMRAYTGHMKAVHEGTFADVTCLWCIVKART